MKHGWSLVCFAAALVGAIAACTGSDDSQAGPSRDAGTFASNTCATDPRVTPYAAGLQAKSTTGRLVVEIVDATPSPPVRGEGDAGMNVWKLKITLDGKPVSADAVTVSTYMPDHGHRSPLIPKVTSNGDGTFALTDLYLFMGGVWQITFNVLDDAEAGADAGSEIATFSLCVD